MVEIEYLRVTVIWANDRSEVSYAFANGEVIGSLSHAGADSLEAYLVALRKEEWTMLTEVQSSPGIESYYFKRTVA